jgi:hypothetical protein
MAHVCFSGCGYWLAVVTPVAVGVPSPKCGGLELRQERGSRISAEVLELRRSITSHGPDVLDDALGLWWHRSTSLLEPKGIGKRRA